MENKPKINMTRIVISGLLMLSVVLTGVNSRRVMALTEYIDNEDGHWSDISLAINNWPLNNSLIFRIIICGMYYMKRK